MFRMIILTVGVFRNCFGILNLKSWSTRLNDFIAFFFINNIVLFKFIKLLLCHHPSFQAWQYMLTRILLLVLGLSFKFFEKWGHLLTAFSASIDLFAISTGDGRIKVLYWFFFFFEFLFLRFQSLIYIAFVFRYGIQWRVNTDWVYWHCSLWGD